jgi:hypothetical protein
MYRYGFHRFGGQPPVIAFELALHGARTQVQDEAPPAEPEAPEPGPSAAG